MNGTPLCELWKIPWAFKQKRKRKAPSSHAPSNALKLAAVDCAHRPRVHSAHPSPNPARPNGLAAARLHSIVRMRSRPCTACPALRQPRPTAPAPPKTHLDTAPPAPAATRCAPAHRQPGYLHGVVHARAGAELGGGAANAATASSSYKRTCGSRYVVAASRGAMGRMCAAPQHGRAACTADDQQVARAQ